MVKRIASVAIILLWCAHVSAVQTLLTNEMFSSVGTLTNGSSRSFGLYVDGALYARPVGPRTASIDAPGWSADPRMANLHMGYDLATWTAADPLGSIGFWIRFNNFGTAPATAGRAAEFLFCSTASSPTRTLSIGVKATGQLNIQDTVSNNLGSTLVSNTWYYIMLEWQNAGGSQLAYKVSTKPLGGGWTTEIDKAAFNNTSRHIKKVQLMDGGSGATYNWGGRLGAFSLCSIGAIGDGDIPASIIAPVEEGHTWYVNPSTGSDGNTGLASTNAWQTANKLATELFYSGVIATTAPWLSNGVAVGSIADADFIAGIKNGTVTHNGDRVVIDTSSSALISTNTIKIPNYQPGIALVSASGVANITCLQSLSGFTQYDPVTFTNIWQTSNFSTRAVLWEDRKWMYALTNVNIVAVRTNLQSTPGSFYNDGTNIYFHSFGSSDPTTDGKTYERSTYLYDAAGANGGSSLIGVFGSDCYLSGIKAGGLTLINATNAALDAVYGLYLDAGGRSVFKDCEFFYGGNHDMGNVGTGGDTNAMRLYWRVACGQSPAFAGSGSFTSFVEYNNEADGTRRAYYHECSVPVTVGAYNSTAGALSSQSNSQNSWYSHTGGANTQKYSAIELLDCNFVGGPVSMAQALVATNAWTLTGGAAFSVGTGSGNLIVDRCNIYDTFAAGSGGITVRNSLARFMSYPMDSSGYYWQGNVTVEGCTFDGRNLSLPTNSNAAMFHRAGSLTLNFRNNIVYVPDYPTKTPLVFAINTADTVTCSNNVYRLEATAGYVAKLLDGAATVYTLTTWKAAGKDANTLNSDPCLSANYRPYAKTPCWNVGVELGPLTDYSNKLYQSRRTVGAYEYTTLKPDYILTGP